MKRIFNHIRFAIMLVFLVPVFAFAAPDVELTLKLTGTVVSHEDRYTSSCIADDKIWVEGTKYLVVDGKISRPATDVGGMNEKDKAKLVKVEKNKITVEYQGKTYTFKAR